MNVSDNWIINLLILYFLHGIGILICDFWYRSRADLNRLPSYIIRPNISSICSLIFFYPLGVIVQLVARIRRGTSFFIVNSMFETCSGVLFYGWCLYNPTWIFFLWAFVGHILVRRWLQYQRVLSTG